MGHARGGPLCQARAPTVPALWRSWPEGPGKHCSTSWRGRTPTVGWNSRAQARRSEWPGDRAGVATEEVHLVARSTIMGNVAHRGLVSTAKTGPGPHSTALPTPVSNQVTRGTVSSSGDLGHMSRGHSPCARPTAGVPTPVASWTPDTFPHTCPIPLDAPAEPWWEPSPSLPSAEATPSRPPPQLS